MHAEYEGLPLWFYYIDYVRDVVASAFVLLSLYYLLLPYVHPQVAREPVNFFLTNF